MSTTSSQCKPVITTEIKALEKCLKSPLHDPTGRCQLEAFDAMKSLKKRGLKVLGVGTQRKVFEISSKCVMKIPYDYNSARANINEFQSWKKIKLTKDKHVIRLFVPVSHASESGAYLVMPKVDMGERPDRPHLIDQAFVQIEKSNLECHDLHARNWGILKDRAVIIDYGFGVKCEIRRKGDWG